MRLRGDYFAATGSMPPRTAHPDTPGPFAKMVAGCLRLARAPTVDPDDDRTSLAVQLTNDIERIRKLEKLANDWRELLERFWHCEAVERVARLIEEGKANVRRVSTGTEQIDGDGRPVLFEIEDAGTLCFYLSAKQSQVIAIKPYPRAAIMRTAECLLKAMRRKGSVRDVVPSV